MFKIQTIHSVTVLSKRCIRYNFKYLNIHVFGCFAKAWVIYLNNMLARALTVLISD